MRALLLALLLTAPLAAQPALGETTFPNSGSAEAQEPFLRGILLLHSFEYDDAREAFQAARQLDPEFAMAAWGEAMTHNHPIWQRQDRDAALAALGDSLWRDIGLGLDIEGVTAREEAYLMTLRALFAGEGADDSKDTRDDHYAEAMRQLAERFPDDLDARTFYALALLGTAHEGRDFTTYMKAAAVAEEVFDINPRHPGAAHYLIHAYDDPVHAPLGLRPARVYAEIAPSASHALHMPSHIYLALGMWEDVAAMNERSYLAAKEGTDRRGAVLNGHGWHALWWWHYAATQLYDPALGDRLLDLAFDHAQVDPDGGTAQAHIVRIAAAHSVSFGAPDVIDHPLTRSASGISTQAIRDLARVVWLTQTSQPSRLAQAEALTSRLAVAVEADDDPSWAVRSALLQMRARVVTARDGITAGLSLLKEAADLEAAAPLTFGPPAPIIPSAEELGGMLMVNARYAEAIVAFEAALARTPNRRQAMESLQAARQGLAEQRAREASSTAQ